VSHPDILASRGISAEPDGFAPSRLNHILSPQSGMGPCGPADPPIPPEDS